MDHDFGIRPGHFVNRRQHDPEKPFWDNIRRSGGTRDFVEREFLIGRSPERRILILRAVVAANDLSGWLDDFELDGLSDEPLDHVIAILKGTPRSPVVQRFLQYLEMHMFADRGSVLFDQTNSDLLRRKTMLTRIMYGLAPFRDFQSVDLMPTLLNIEQTLIVLRRVGLDRSGTRYIGRFS